MGGRRAPTLGQALGSPVPPKLARQLDQGLANRDAEAVSKAASDLARRAIPPAELASHLRLFVPFIKEKLRDPIPPAELRSVVRRQWASLKKARDIHVSQKVNDSVEQAVIAFLKARS